MEWIRLVAYVVFVGVSLLMVLFVLLQEGKGGGLSALGGTQAESAFGASNPIRRMTVVLSILFFLLAGFLVYFGSRGQVRIDEPEAPMESPAEWTPSVETPEAEAPAAETPEAATPEAEAPAAETPEAATPADQE